MNDDVFRRYNADNLASDIAESHGWTEVSRTQSRVFYARPGGSGDNGANYMASKNVFFVHTTSADLTPGAYSAFDLFKHYECGGDMKAATRALHDLYCTNDRQSTDQAPTKLIVPDAHRFDPNDPDDEPNCIITVKGGGQDKKFIPSPGLLTITGHAGIGKTSVVRAITAAIISGSTLAGFKGDPTWLGGKKVFWFETEQPRFIFNRNMKTIGKMAGGFDRFDAFWMSPMNHRQRRAKVREIVQQNRDDIGMIVIDGWRDLMSDINDNKETEDLIGEAISWRDDLGILVAGVLHMNPGTRKMRGTVGTEFLNKSDGVIEVVKGDAGNATVEMGRGRAWGFWNPYPIYFDEGFIPYSPDDPGRQWSDSDYVF